LPCHVFQMSADSRCLEPAPESTVEQHVSPAVAAKYEADGLYAVGGWTYSPQFHPVVVSASHRARFVESSIRILEDYGLEHVTFSPLQRSTLIFDQWP
jgi:GH18 family chitinase